MDFDDYVDQSDEMLEEDDFDWEDEEDFMDEDEEDFMDED